MGGKVWGGKKTKGQIEEKGAFEGSFYLGGQDSESPIDPCPPTPSFPNYTAHPLRQNAVDELAPVRFSGNLSSCLGRTRTRTSQHRPERTRSASPLGGFEARSSLVRYGDVCMYVYTLARIDVCRSNKSHL